MSNSQSSAHNRLRLAVHACVSRKPGITTREVAAACGRYVTIYRALEMLRELERDGFVVRQHAQRVLVWLPKDREQLSLLEGGNDGTR